MVWEEKLLKKTNKLGCLHFEIYLYHKTEISAEVFANSGTSLCPTLLLAHAPMSLTCNAHRWEQPLDSHRVKNHCVCQERERHPDEDEV